MKLAILICFLFSYSGVSAQVPANSVPGFTFFKMDGKRFKNNELTLGKKSVFLFFDATCIHCQKAISFFNKHHSELKHTSTYLISLDAKATMQAFLKKYAGSLLKDKNVLTLQDMNNEFILKFKPRKYPSMFLYSEKQKLLFYDDEEKNAPKLLQLVHAK